MNTQGLIHRLASWPATLTFCLLIVLGTLAVKLWPRTVPFEQCSDVYKKYAGVDGVDATFLKDFKVNDSVSVDVVLLEARTDSAWGMLQREFGLPIIPKEYEALYYEDSNTVDLKFVPKDQLALKMDSVVLNNNIAIISFPKHEISIFEIRNMSQVEAILKDNFKKTI